MELGDSNFTLAINAAMSAAGFLVCYNIIPKFKEMFINANLFGIDMGKKSKVKVPESLGVICGAVYLIIMFLFIPAPFYKHLAESRAGSFPYHEYIEYLAALLSICCMIFLGFADDVLNLKWRHKLLLPTMASLPLLLVYFVNFNSTTIIVPRPFRALLGFDLNLGGLYYVYMGMLAVFCTNAINILSGVNGLEVGQSWVICVSVLIHNFLELSGPQHQAHTFSIYFLMPFLGVSSALLHYNWYPSAVFVGDTFCYFAGMTFAVVAILAHFSKTLMLFFLPQVANFLLSTPQLFRLLHCPRHRLPRYNAVTDKMEASVAVVKTSSLGAGGRWILSLLSTLRLVTLTSGVGEDGDLTEFSNLTLNNLLLQLLGPLHERTLVSYLLTLQVFCSVVGFVIRYQVAKLFYD